MRFTLSQAAKEAGVSKSTLSKAVHTGRLSAERLPEGSFQIDASELFRVFPRRTTEGVAETVHEQPRTPAEHPDSELALMRLKVEMLEGQLSRERELRDQERQTSQETVADLRRRLNRAEERVLSLTAEPLNPMAKAAPAIGPEELPAPPAPQPRRGLLARLFGRS